MFLPPLPTTEPVPSEVPFPAQASATTASIASGTHAYNFI
jgi:hypothetical protein